MDKPRVHLVQCLCPQRHCIMAFAYLPGLSAAQKDLGSMEDITLTSDNAPGYLRALVEDAIAAHIFNPFCGICKSRDLRYEDGVTVFETIDEARPFLEESGRQQMATRDILGQTGQN